MKERYILSFNLIFFSFIFIFENQSGVFLFSDNQIINEGFIEDINNILTVGEVPNLFSQKDDYPNIKEKMKKKYIEHH